jgi:hypothetical protein
LQGAPARALKNQLMRGLLFETRNGHLAVKARE